VASVCFSPDGDFLASTGYDQAVRTWDLRATRSRLRRMAHKSQVTSLAASPDGRWLASAGGDWDPGAYRYVRGELMLWNVSSDDAARRLLGQAVGVTCVAFSLDGH
jgi:WD40 repeat protein